MSKYSPSAYILREAGRIVRMTTIADSNRRDTAREFWKSAALAFAYAKSDPDAARVQLRNLRWYQDQLTGTPRSVLMGSTKSNVRLHDRG